MIAATAITVLSGLFGDPTAIAVAAPVVAAVTVTWVPAVRERLACVIPLLALGWLGGALREGLLDPSTVNHLSAALARRGGDHEHFDALGAGGAAAGREVLADTDNAPVFVLGRSGAGGILGPSSEPFALALLVFPDRDCIRCGPGSAKQHRRDQQVEQRVSDALSRGYARLWRCIPK
jgi:hypothetical protein